MLGRFQEANNRSQAPLWHDFRPPPDPHLPPPDDFRFWPKFRFFHFSGIFRLGKCDLRKFRPLAKKPPQLAPNCSEPPQIKFFGRPKVSPPTPAGFFAPERNRGDFVFRDAQRNPQEPNFGITPPPKSKQNRNLINFFRSVGALVGGQKSFPGTAGPCFSTPRTYISHLATTFDFGRKIDFFIFPTFFDFENVT